MKVKLATLNDTVSGKTIARIGYTEFQQGLWIGFTDGTSLLVSGAADETVEAADVQSVPVEFES